MPRATMDKYAFTVRTPNEVRWPQHLQALASFLRRADAAQVRIRHHHAAAEAETRP